MLFPTNLCVEDKEELQSGRRQEREEDDNADDHRLLSLPSLKGPRGFLLSLSTVDQLHPVLYRDRKRINCGAGLLLRLL